MIDALQRVFYKDTERNDIIFDECIFKLETERSVPIYRATRTEISKLNTDHPLATPPSRKSETISCFFFVQTLEKAKRNAPNFCFI